MSCEGVAFVRVSGTEAATYRMYSITWFPERAPGRKNFLLFTIQFFRALDFVDKRIYVRLSVFIIITLN